MTTELRKAIMVRSRLKNTWNKEKSYTKQRNFCTNLLRKAKREYFSKLDTKKISDNKTFWKTVKPLFSEKYHTTESITLVESNQIIDKDDCIADTFNDLFSNAVKTDTNSDPIINAVNKYTNHPSIRKIIAEEQNDSFSFEFTSVQKVYKEINLLNPSKAFPKYVIPPQFIKDYPELFAVKIENDFNVCEESCVFPTNQKHADVTPVYKNGDRNQRPTIVQLAFWRNYSYIR